jgi:transposase InsO family protein
LLPCLTTSTPSSHNGIHFINRLKDRWASKHLFNRNCEGHGIEHRLTKVNHPWTNGQVERMNRTIKDADGQELSL